MALLLDYEFAPPPDSKEIDTKVFLESVFQLPSFLDRLGFKVFKLIRDDIKESITTIKAVYDSDPVKYETLQQILIAEKSMYGSEWPKAGATLALMWLKRCLRFIQILLQSLADGERDKDNPNLIRINISKAYDEALKRYHGWMIQNVFKVKTTQHGCNYNTWSWAHPFLTQGWVENNRRSLISACGNLMHGCSMCCTLPIGFS
ncbi:glycolipid transfer protein-like isoform X3 [Misgurnus anguillicaudatus]|uniref:glycolipid transfer protein-like isoform X3 n=1 Tax=Misgurnus anguillicaudatus TaxID=75329 RepID=UPI003CCF4040